MAEKPIFGSICSHASSSGSDSSSTGEEGRLRELFVSCDTNQDGFLDEADLGCMCAKLNMADMAGEIVHALGADVNGVISFDDFLRVRRHFMGAGSMINACSTGLISGSNCGEKISHHEPSVGDFLNKVVNGYRDDDFHQRINAHDIGGNSLSLQHSRQKYQTRCPVAVVAPATGGLDSSASDTSLVNSGAEYDSGAQDLSGEPLNLHKLLKQGYPEIFYRYYTSGNDSLTPQPAVAALLECANAAHLAKLTSLRSELRDALHRLRTAQHNRDQVAKEAAKMSRERSKLRSELRATSARYEDRLTELHSVIAELQKKLERSEGTRIHGVIEEECDEDLNEEEEEDVEGEEDLNDVVGGATPVVGMQLEVGDHHRALQTQQQQHVKLQSQLQVLSKERDHLLQRLQQQQKLTCAPVSDSLPATGCGLKSPHNRHGACTSPLMSSQTCSTGAGLFLSEALLQRLQMVMMKNDTPSATTCEFLSTLIEVGPEPLSAGARVTLLAQERQAAQVERLNSDAALLQLCLEESKSTAERLSAANLQHEANSAAQSRAQLAADRALEAADILLQLAESETALLVASYSSGGNDVGVQRAALARRQAEAAAKNLLHRLEGSGSNHQQQQQHHHHHHHHGGGGGASLAAVAGRTTPDSGQVLSNYSSAASTTSSCSEPFGGASSSSDYATTTPPATASSAALQQLLLSSCGELSRAEERRLKGYLDEFRAERHAYRSQVVEVDYGGGSSSCGTGLTSPLSSASCAAAAENLELAVLMQELCVVKEERAELKARVYLLERDAASTSLQLSARDAVVVAARAQIEALQTQQQQSPTSSSPPPGAREQREFQLCARIQELVAALDTVTRSSEQRQLQNEEFCTDLKRANAALIVAFEKARRKYQLRIKKLETALLGNGGGGGSTTADDAAMMSGFAATAAAVLTSETAL